LPFDVDLGVFPIQDWYYASADQILLRVSDASNPFAPGLPGAPPPSDNVLFNGTNINPSGPGGNYARVKITPGLRHRLRLINPSVENTFTVSIVNHQMTVIAADFVPVNAFSTDSLFLGVGQRYDVTIDASQAVDNYWINVTFSGTRLCGQSNNPAPAAILTYDGADDGALPTNPGVAPVDSLCADLLDIAPVVPRTPPIADFLVNDTDTLPVALQVNNNRVFWNVKNVAINVTWDQPTLQLIQQGNDNFPASSNIFEIPGVQDVS